eukprot:TRINITY_DN15498_c0_g1_i4.p1 TRINITY_DN15498_c0_g1~~TRINITY_DN15498_c0_g1_i4.p1  ORF type:complete len:448 (+),score=142.28 TRINITY_DN15498_c0_g1_i4:226-1569(+)
MGQFLVVLALLLAIGLAQPQPSRKELLTSLAKAQSKAALAQVEWKKRLADVSHDPSKANSKSYQQKLEETGKRLAEAEVEMEVAQRAEHVTERVRDDIREEVSKVEGSADLKAAALRGQKRVVDERNDAVEMKVRQLRKQSDDLDRMRKEAKMNTQLSVRSALVGIGNGVRHTKSLERKLATATDDLQQFTKRGRQIDGQLLEAKRLREAVDKATEKLKGLREEKKQKKKTIVRSPVYAGSEDGGGWYDILAQGLCNDFCRTVALPSGERKWRCSLAGGGESDEHEEQGQKQCAHKGGFSDSPAGHEFGSLQQKIELTQETISKLSGLAATIDVGHLEGELVINKGEVAAAEAHEQLLEESVDASKKATQAEKRAMHERAPGDNRVAMLQKQLDELKARKKWQGKQIEALAEAARLAKFADPPLEEVVYTNGKLAKYGLPDDKLPIS